MATVIEVINNLENLIPLLETETARIIQRSPQLLQAKREEFKRGESPDGSRIGFYSNPAYRSFKRQQNPLAGGTVDLILTGQFTRQLIVEKSGNGLFQFDSRDDKAPELFAKYGSDLRGLNDKTWLDVQIEYIAPELNKFIKRYTGL